MPGAPPRSGRGLYPPARRSGRRPQPSGPLVDPPPFVRVTAEGGAAAGRKKDAPAGPGRGRSRPAASGPCARWAACACAYMYMCICIYARTALGVSGAHRGLWACRCVCGRVVRPAACQVRGSCVSCFEYVQLVYLGRFVESIMPKSVRYVYAYPTWSVSAVTGAPHYSADVCACIHRGVPVGRSAGLGTLWAGRGTCAFGAALEVVCGSVAQAIWAEDRAAPLGLLPHLRGLCSLTRW